MRFSFCYRKQRSNQFANLAGSSTSLPDVVTASLDQTIRWWKVKIPKKKSKTLEMEAILKQEFVGHTAQVDSLSLSPSKKQVRPYMDTFSFQLDGINLIWCLYGSFVRVLAITPSNSGNSLQVPPKKTLPVSQLPRRGKSTSSKKLL